MQHFSSILIELRAHFSPEPARCKELTDALLSERCRPTHMFNNSCVDIKPRLHVQFIACNALQLLHAIIAGFQTCSKIFMRPKCCSQWQRLVESRDNNSNCSSDDISDMTSPVRYDITSHTLIDSDSPAQLLKQMHAICCMQQIAHVTTV